MRRRETEDTEDKDQAARVLAAVIEQRKGNLIAALVSFFRDIDKAQDCLQEACTRALEHWPRSGVPDHPAAWLLVTAKRLGIDRARRDTVWTGKAEQLTRQKDQPGGSDELQQLKALDANELDDELLRLIFLCCHPALRPRDQVGLTLHTVCGLDTSEVARAFLVRPKTMAQRLVRSKRKVRQAGIPFRIPPAKLLPERLDAVLTAIYLIFNEGYLSTSEASRADLCKEAVRLASLTARLLPKKTEAAGLLALLLLIDARSATRFNEEGVLVELPKQDRSKWDRRQIGRASELLERTLGRSSVGPFQVLASIQALHAGAPSSEETDWPQIVELYDILYRLQPTPVVKLNRAVATRMAEGPEPALGMLRRLEARGELAEYHLFYVALADCLDALGEVGASIAALETARELATNPAEQHRIDQLLAERKSALAKPDQPKTPS